MTSLSCSDPRTDLYLAELRRTTSQPIELVASETKAGSNSVTLTIKFTPIAFEERRFDVRVKCLGRISPHIWDVKDWHVATVRDVPLGSLHVKLKTSRPRYGCRNCTAVTKSLWPAGFLMQAGALRVTQRLFKFLVDHWADGCTQQELADATGLPATQISRATKAAHTMLPNRKNNPVPPPRVIGIDELYFHKRYHTVVTDLSNQKETRLIDIVIGRDGDKEHATPKGERTLTTALRQLAWRYLVDSRLQETREKRLLLSPILTADGWSAFRETMTTAFEATAQREGLNPPKIHFCADLFHLVADLKSEDRKALKVLKRSSEIHKNSEKRDVDNLHKLAVSILNYKDETSLRHFSYAFERHVLDFTARQKHLDTTDLNPYPKLQEPDFHRRVYEYANSPEDNRRQPGIRQEIDEQKRELRKQLEARHQTEFRKARKLLKNVVAAGEAFLAAGTRKTQTPALAHWHEALNKYDASTWTSIENSYYNFRKQERRWGDDTFIHHSQDGSFSHRQHEERKAEASTSTEVLRLSASLRYVEVLPQDLNAPKESHPQLHEDATRLAEHFSQLSNTQIPEAYANPHAKQTKAINEQFTAAGYDPPFVIHRPSNSRTERLNRSLREIIAVSSPRTPFAILRDRLLCRFSGTITTARTTKHITDIPLITLAPPDTCPHCGSTNLTIHENTYFKESWIDVPIGWHPNKYKTRTPKWTCHTSTCQTASSQTSSTGAKHTPALDAYLHKLATAPRHASLSISTWARRTGVPRNTLSKLLPGPSSLYTPTPDDPALVLALTITSNTYKADRPPRVLLTDLRHRTTPEGNPRQRSLLPARVITHEHMTLNQVLEQLTKLHDTANRQIIVFTDRTITPGWTEELTKQAGNHWRLAKDAYNAMRHIKQASHRTYNHWNWSTRIKVAKHHRRSADKNRASPDELKQREKDETTMKEFFTTNLKRPSDHTLTETIRHLSRVTRISTNDPDFNADDIIQLRNYLHNWWLTLIQAPHYNREEFTEALHDLLNNPPQPTAQRPRKTLENFMSRMTTAVPLLINTKTIPHEGLYPDTRTGHFHMAKIGTVRNQIKLARTRTGHG